MGGKAKAPAAPNFLELQKQDAAQNRANAEWTMNQNRFDQTGPLGSAIWNTDPVTGKISFDTKFNPAQQGVLDSETALNQALNKWSLNSLNQLTPLGNPLGGSAGKSVV